MKSKLIVTAFGIVLLASLVVNVHQYRESMAGKTEQEEALLKSIGGRQKLAAKCLALEKQAKELEAEVHRLKSVTPLLYVFTDGSYWSIISDRPFPKHKKLHRTLELGFWEGHGEVIFHPVGSRRSKGGMSVDIYFAGCGNEQSTICLYKIRTLTVRRHPDDYDLTVNRDKCLTQWAQDEARIAVGVEDGEGLTAEEILRRIRVHFERIWDENRLWVSARGSIWADQSVGRAFIN